MSKHNPTASRKSRKATTREALHHPLFPAAPAADAEKVEANFESFEEIRKRCERDMNPTERCLFLIQQEKYSCYEMGGLLTRMDSGPVRDFEEWVTKKLRMSLRKARSLMRVYQAINQAKDDGWLEKYEHLEGVDYSALLVLVPIFSSKDREVLDELPRLLDVARKRTFKELVEEMKKVRKPTKPGRSSDPMKLLSAALDKVFKDAANPPDDVVLSIVEMLKKRAIGLRITVTRAKVAERAKKIAAKAAALRDGDGAASEESYSEEDAA